MSDIIGFHGKLGAGKNEAEVQIRGILPYSELYEQRAFADNVKLFAARLCGTDLGVQYTHEGKNTLYDPGDLICNIPACVAEMRRFNVFKDRDPDDLRKAMEDIMWKACLAIKKPKICAGEVQQQVGEKFRAVFGADVWVNILFEYWEPNSHWIITDVRYPNEKERIWSKGGKNVKLFGDPKGVRLNSKRDLNHESETALDHDDKWDWVIDNQADDIENLRRQLSAFVSEHYLFSK